MLNPQNLKPFQEKDVYLHPPQIDEEEEEQKSEEQRNNYMV